MVCPISGQFAVDATKNALTDIESRDRPKREADPEALTEDDIQQRLQKLQVSTLLCILNHSLFKAQLFLDLTPLFGI
jgi:hypothetical protein